MTHTIELSPDLEKRIEAQALRRGVPIEKYLREIIEAWTREAEPIEEAAAPMSQEQKADVKARLPLRGYGKYAGIGPTVDEFLAERHAEARREAEADERCLQARHEATP